MRLTQQQHQTQALLLTQKMRQSLRLLQLPAPDLESYLEEEALSNPLLEVEPPALGQALSEVLEAEEPRSEREESLPIERREQQLWSGSGSGPRADFADYTSREESFSDSLLSQLGQLSMLDPYIRALSEYLVGCLSPAGYLDCPLDELSAELGCPLFDLEQALFVVQSLEPTGVGARSLSECLLLQLAQSRHFTELNIHLVRRGLPKLADGDYAALAEDLHATEEEVRAAADYIRTLNPIPSRGFPTGSYTHYVVPEATLHWEGDTLHIDMNTAAQPRVSLNTETAGLLEAEDTREAQVYLRRKLQDARSLMDSLQDRQDTLFRLISAVARLQSGFFARGEALQPMTMSQVAEELNVNISTVSRAVKDKYIQYSGKVYSLRSLFSAPIPSQDGGEISADGARRQIQRCVEAEDPAHPLSDSAICAALAALNISLSRRTVAKYRAELGIPPASKRRSGGGK